MQKNRKGWIWRWMFTSVLSLMAGVWLTGCGKTASDFIKGDTKGTSQSFAVAYLGYVEEGDRQDIEGWIRKNCPILCADYPFLTGIPEERIVGKEPAELYCIIPGDSNISVEVDHMELNLEEGIMEKDACLYQSDSTDPFSGCIRDADHMVSADGREWSGHGTDNGGKYLSGKRYYTVW